MQKIMTEKERMLSEKLYIPMDEALAADCARSRRLVRLINGTTEEQAEYRVQLFKELFGRTGENLWVEPPFHCDYGWPIFLGGKFLECPATTAAIFLWVKISMPILTVSFWMYVM